MSIPLYIVTLLQFWSVFFCFTSRMGKQRTAYTTKEKLAAIRFAKAHGNKAAQREFSINESNIRDWRKKKDRLEKLPKSKMADKGSKAHHPVLKEELMSFVTDRRRRAVRVSMRELRKEAKKIAKRQKITTFGGSINWVYAFYVVTICLFAVIPTSRRNYRGTTKISCLIFSASSSTRERILTMTYHKSAMPTRHHWRLPCYTTLRSTPRVPSPSSWTRQEMKRIASPWCWPLQQMAGNYHTVSYSMRRRSRKSHGRRESSSVARTKGGRRRSDEGLGQDSLGQTTRWPDKEEPSRSWQLPLSRQQPWKNSSVTSARHI